uniref:hypothetical protein n=1 Tax=Amycolatopsis sp. CA-151526 TaxID=3239921 RepID=UPI003F495E2C
MAAEIAKAEDAKSRGGRPRTGRDDDFTVAIKPDVKKRFKDYCRARKINASALFEQWVEQEMRNPSQPELAESA